MPASDGLFLGETTTPRRWDGRKVINLNSFEVRYGTEPVFLNFNNIPVLDAQCGGLGLPFTGIDKSRFTVVSDYSDPDNPRWVVEPKDIGWDAKRRNNQYYCAGVCNATVLQEDAISANIIYAMPFFLLKDAYNPVFAINVIVGQSGKSVRIGIYDDLDCYPNNLLYEYPISVGTTGVKTYSPNVPFYVNVIGSLLWFVIVSNGTPTLRSLPLAAAFPKIGFASTLPTVGGVGWTIAYTYASLPNPFPAGASPITATPIPAIFMKSANW